MMFYRTASRHRRLIDQSGNPLEESQSRLRYSLGLAHDVEPQPPVSEPLPVLAAQSVRGSRTLGLRVPSAPQPAVVPDLLGLSADRERLALLAFERESAQSGVGQTDWLAVLRLEFARVGAALTAVSESTQARLREQHSVLSRASQALRRLVGRPVRFVSPVDQARRLEEAYAQGGTEQVARLTPSLLAELDARALHGVAGVSAA